MVTVVAAALGLLAAAVLGDLLALPGLVVLDAADRLASVAGIAGLTVLMERSLRRGRSTVVPVAMLGQLALLVGPALVHADAVGATYDPRTLLVGAVVQCALTAAVVLAALRVGDAVQRALTPLAPLAATSAGSASAGALLAPLRSLVVPRPPGRAPPRAVAA